MNAKSTTTSAHILVTSNDLEPVTSVIRMSDVHLANLKYRTIIIFHKFELERACGGAGRHAGHAVEEEIKFDGKVSQFGSLGICMYVCGTVPWNTGNLRCHSWRSHSTVYECENCAKYGAER